MSEDFMKSALDRAMERADRIQIPEEKLREMEYQSLGEKLAASFLKQPGYDLKAGLDTCDAESRTYVAKALESILLQNLVLPKKDLDFPSNDKIFEGLLSIKKTSKAIQEAKEQLTNLSSYYIQARTQHYDQLKSQVEQAIIQQIRQQTGTTPTGNLNIEQRPEFQENWRKVSAQLDIEYEKALQDLKDRIASTGF